MPSKRNKKLRIMARPGTMMTSPHPVEAFAPQECWPLPQATSVYRGHIPMGEIVLKLSEFFVMEYTYYVVFSPSHGVVAIDPGKMTKVQPYRGVQVGEIK